MSTSSVRLEMDSSGATLHWEDGTRDRYLYFWLRENCPEDGNSLTGQRSLSLSAIPDDIQPSGIELRDDALSIQWPDGHETIHQTEWLREQSRPRGDARFQPEVWDSSLSLDDLNVSHADIAGDPAYLFDCMVKLVRFGVVRILDAPTDATEDLARRFGYLHDTNYGVSLDIKSEIKPWFRVLSRDSIPPHTDNVYRYTPTGISFFHCIEQIEGPGGESFYIDGLRLAQRIREVDPDSFDFLCNVPLMFHRQIPENASLQIDPAAFCVQSPVFRRNSDGQVVGVRYHPRTVAPFHGSDRDVRRMYKARKQFETHSMDPDLRIEFQAQPGECTIYDNHRVLHARHGFEQASAGTRHFRQCHIDREELHSKLRLLGQMLGREVPEHLISPGVAF